MAAFSDAACVGGFQEVWEGQQELVAEIEAALAMQVSAFDTEWLGEYVGAPPPAQLRVIASLSTGGNNYGARFVIGDMHETTAVLAVSRGPVLVHEVGHDFQPPHREPSQ